MLIERVRQKFASRQLVRIAVVGGGPGATEFVIRFLEAGGHQLPISFSIFEHRPKLGRGVAWSPEKTEVLANMRVHTLGPSYPEFELVETLLKELRHPEAAAEYPTRNAVGAALDERWRIKGETFPQIRALEHVPKEVIDLEWNGETATIVCEPGDRRDHFDLVVLALGNLSAQRPHELASSNRVINGWDVRAYESIAPDADVLIQGAGLTAIDATLRLLAQGHQVGNRSIVWQSRGGHLPYVRPKQLLLDPEYLGYPALEAEVRRLRTNGESLTLHRILTLFRWEMLAQQKKSHVKCVNSTDYAGFCSMLKRFEDPARCLELLDHGIRGASGYSLWFSVAKLLDEFTIPFLWNALPDEEKAKFLQLWRRDFDRYWAPIPVDNARRIKDWIANDVIQLLKTKVEHAPDPANGRIIFNEAMDDPLGKRSKQELVARYSRGFDYLIEAGGIPTDLEKIESALVKNLLARGVLIPYKIPQMDRSKFHSLGARVDWYSGAVLGADDRALGWLFSLTGSLTAGAHRFTNSYLAVSMSADRLAKSLLGSIDPPS